MTRRLSCPRDRRPMHALTVQAKDGGEEIELDRCRACGAVWFDAGELERTAELTTRAARADSEHRCLVCRDPMREVTLTGKALEAYRCDTCFGMWLDGGTVEKLLHGVAEPPQDGPPVDDEEDLTPDDDDIDDALDDSEDYVDMRPLLAALHHFFGDD